VQTRRIALYVLLALPLLVPFPYVRGLNNPNELVRVYTVIALVENRTYVIDEQVEAFGQVEDMALVRGKGGAMHHVMVKAPGIVYAGIPGYLVFRHVIAPLTGLRYPGRASAATPADEEALETTRLRWLRGSTAAMRLSASQLPCLLFLVWLERYLRRISPDAVLRAVVVAAAGLGTNLLAYAHMFASHTAYAMVAFLAFAILERGRARDAAVAGFLTGACVALEYQALFPSLVLSCFAVVVFASRPRGLPALAAFAAGGLVHACHVMWFQYCAYGSPFTPGHKLLENARFAAEHRTGLWGISWPEASRIVALLTDPGFGLFGLSPLLALGLVSIPIALVWPGGADPAERRRRRLATTVWSTCMAAAIGVNAGFIEWRAGWTVGPRYLVVCAPFFALGALALLERIATQSLRHREVARGTAAGLATAGILSVGTVGVLVDTLPDAIGRPFTQFFVPMLRAGFVPHDIGEWIGLRAGALWYLALAALVVTPLAVLMLGARRLTRAPAILIAYVVALSVGMLPALSPADDGSARFVMHPSTTWFQVAWEPSRPAAIAAP
jgi:hypothetical protein